MFLVEALEYLDRIKGSGNRWDEKDNVEMVKKLYTLGARRVEIEDPDLVGDASVLFVHYDLTDYKGQVEILLYMCGRGCNEISREENDQFRFFWD